MYKGLHEIDPVIFSLPFLILLVIGVIISSTFFWLSIPKLDIKLPSTLLLLVIAISLIFLTLFDRTMEEKHLFAPSTSQYFHTVPFVSPIFDVLNGRIVLANTYSQYGVFTIYLPAIFLKFFSSFSFTNFFYLMIAFGIVYYFLIYLLLQKRLSSFWAFVGIITIFSLHFYFAKDRYTHPMMFPLRYLLDMPFFLLLLNYSQKRTKIKEIFLFSYIFFSIFYNYETGISLLIAYLAYSVVYDIQNNQIYQIKRIVFKCLEKLTGVIFFFMLFLFLYNLYALLFAGELPKWSDTFFYIKILGRRLSSNYHLFDFHLYYLGIYLFFLSKTLIFLKLRKKNQYLAWDASLAFYGVMIFTYYIEKGYILNLVSVSIPAIILGIIMTRDFFLLAHLPENHRQNFLFKYLIFGPWLILSSFSVFSLLYYIYRFNINSNYDYWTKNSHTSEELFNQIALSAQVIKKYQLEEKQVAILSYFDTLLGLQANKINLFPYSTSQNVITYEQAHEVENVIIKTRPEYVFADMNEQLEINKYPLASQYLRNYYHIIETVGIINVWKAN